jgi:general secretion pathway protein D
MVKPQIAEGDHLLLDYSVAISSFVGTSTNPSLPPPRQQNTLNSVVAIPDGFTVAVGGLQIDRNVEATTQIPFVGDIPILGEAFKSRTNTVSRNRFYVFLRGSILRQQGFEDLKYLSSAELREADVGDPDAPKVEPLVIR